MPDLLSCDQLKAEVQAAQQELLAIRRHLHAHPELSGNEHQTAALVAGELRNGLEGPGRRRPHRGGGRTGIREWARGGSAGGHGRAAGGGAHRPALCLAESGVDARLWPRHSHDRGVGGSRILGPLAERLGGTVRLLFQPAEETAQGAAWMVADGAMQGVDALFGVHVFPSLPVGTIGVRSGSLTAAAGELEVEVLGEGGHGARPTRALTPSGLRHGW